MSLNKSVPAFYFQDTIASADNKRWRFLFGFQNLYIDVLQDDFSASSAVIISRSGITVSEIELNATTLDFNGTVDVSAHNIVTDTSTGTKIGTATNQKIGFFNQTPVVQPTAVADATTAVDVITQFNALLTRMRNLGLIAT
jgi:hypothetical protein